MHSIIEDNKIRFIGDIHGLTHRYMSIVEKSKYPTVQVGDFGYGFEGVYNPFKPERTNHRFIRGNHDNPAKCREQPQFIEDGTIENNIGYVGGASSIDRAYRTEGVSWWPDEQLSIAELDAILGKLIEHKPEVIISHECPEFVADVICTTMNKRKFHDDNRTRIMLEQVYYHYKPKLHIFGHWHHDFDWLYQGTRFICLDELSYIDINMDDLPDLDSEIESFYDPRFRHITGV